MNFWYINHLIRIQVDPTDGARGDGEIQAISLSTLSGGERSKTLVSCSQTSNVFASRMINELYDFTKLKWIYFVKTAQITTAQHFLLKLWLLDRKITTAQIKKKTFLIVVF
jgi:hypothetical protein